MLSAFGVDHGIVSKAAGPVESAAEKALKVKLNFKAVTPKKLEGPGSKRGRMDPSAWASRRGKDKGAGR